VDEGPFQSVPARCYNQIPSGMRRVHVLANKVGVMGRGRVRAGTESAWCMPPPWRRRVVAIAIGAAVALVALVAPLPAAHKASFDLLGVVGDTAALSEAAHGAVEGAVNMPERAGPQVVDGMFVRDGLPYRGIGVNYFDAFYRHVKDPQDTSYEAGFSALAAHGIPFARVMAGGFWPSEQRLYMDDPEEFFRRFDGVVRSAEQHGIGLVLTLFWHPSTVPDLMEEPVNAWGDLTSRTHTEMQRYVHDVVTRYVGSPAVWGWEFGNEYSLWASLPNAEEHRPPVWPVLGTPPERTAEDELTVDAVRTAYAAFAREVRRYDPARFISSGNSIPRESAWHNWVEGTWTTDTTSQTAEMLLGDNPDPLDVVSVHAYDGDVDRVPDAVRVAHDIGKPLFLGEFGVLDGPYAREELAAVLQTIEEAGVDLAALWVYDHANQPDWSVTATNARCWQLLAVAAAHARLQPTTTTTTTTTPTCTTTTPTTTTTTTPTTTTTTTPTAPVAIPGWAQPSYTG
jgi:hypothetical protein